MAIRDLSDDEYNADGTYAYPPHPRSLEQHIAFWESVPIPDEKLTQVLNAYDQMVDEDSIADATRALEDWKTRNPDPTLTSRSQKAFNDGRTWQAEGGQVFDQAYDQASAATPKIYRTSIRPIIRAGQMVIYGRPLQEADASRLRQHEMVVNGEIMAVGQIYATYQLDRLGGVIP